MAWGSEWSTRVRIVLSEWFVVFVAIAAILALVGGVATYTAYASPGTAVEERQVSSWEGNGTYTTTARVTEPNPLYPVDTELSNRPAYFLSVSPEMQGRFAFSYQATDGGALDVTIRNQLVMRAVSESEGGVTEFWRMEEPLGSTQAADVGPGQPVESTFVRNVNRTMLRMQNVSERLGGSPGSLQLLSVARVQLTGEVNGQSVNRTAQYVLPIQADGSTYRPGSVRGSAVTGSTTERITRQRTYGPLRRVGGPALLVLGLVGLITLGYGRYDGQFSVSETERAERDFRSTREEYDDWITVARPPASVFDRPRIEVTSLEGLVDTAIDVDARVFERPEGAAYYVLHDDCCYVFVPPTVESRGDALAPESSDAADETDDDETAQPSADA
jgi:hypothetical protein